ncbi:MAG: response regulator [Thermodesulfobacteriota bacterium]
MSPEELKSMKDRLTSATLLLVDDTPYFRILLCNFLGPLKCKNLLEARNGKEALGIMAREKVDLIICDWKMPEMDGLEFLRHVRCHTDWAATPFIMITGKADKTVVVESVRLKVTDFLVKPVDAKTLAQKVLKALSAPPPSPEDLAAACASPAASPQEPAAENSALSDETAAES